MRVKVGVGEKPKGYDLADYVLGHFTGDEKKIMDQAAKDAAQAVRSIMNDGIESAMNKYNAKAKK